MTWILVMVWVNYNGIAAPTQLMFTTQEACESASTLMRNLAEEYRRSIANERSGPRLAIARCLQGRVP